jgi:hypothetical protein
VAECPQIPTWRWGGMGDGVDRGNHAGQGSQQALTRPFMLRASAVPGMAHHGCVPSPMGKQDSFSCALSLSLSSPTMGSLLRQQALPSCPRHPLTCQVSQEAGAGGGTYWPSGSPPPSPASASAGPGTSLEPQSCSGSRVGEVEITTQLLGSLKATAGPTAMVTPMEHGKESGASTGLLI